MEKLTLAAARVNAGKSQKEVAQILGVSPRALGLWESGERCPRIDKALKLCDLYKVPLDGIQWPRLGK